MVLLTSPSYHERFGLFVVEAEAKEASRAPSDVSVAIDAMCHDDTGQIVPVKNKTALKLALKTILHGDHKLKFHGAAVNFARINYENNEFLLLCARSRLKESHVQRIRFLINNKKIDWILLLQAAAHHRVLPLLYTSLQSCCRDLVPAQILLQLRSLYRDNASCNIFLAGTLVMLLKIFKMHHIKAVPFKGPLLTSTVYGALPLRTFGDLDILIAPQDMEQAVQLLLDQGYTLDFNLALDKYLKLVRRGHHASLVHPRNGLVVELHWEMSGRYLTRILDLDYVGPRLEDALLLHQPLLSLGAEDLLLYLCIHGNRHRWVQLDAVCCIAELIRARPSIDWELAVKLAEELGGVRMLLLGLGLARRLLDSTLPPTILKLIEQEQELTQLTRQIKRGLLNPKGKQQGIMHHFGGLAFHFRTMDRVSDGARYTIRKFCIPDGYDIKWLPLPRSLWFLYPVVRPLRFAVDCAQKFTEKKQS